MYPDIVSILANTSGEESETAPKDHVLSVGVEPGFTPVNLNDPLPVGSEFVTEVRFAILPDPTQVEKTGRVDVAEELPSRHETGNVKPTGATRVTVILLTPTTAFGNR